MDAINSFTFLACNRFNGLINGYARGINQWVWLALKKLYKTNK
jgi:hypothetical protein